MLNLNGTGIKLTIALHDRYSLGCWGQDAYVSKYNLPSSPNCAVPQTPALFYISSSAQADFDARLKHIVSHRNLLMGNATWASLSSIIYSFDIQNESQAHMKSIVNPDWLCKRATNLKPLLTAAAASKSKGPILISTGGGADFDDSMLLNNFVCPAIDVVALHSYYNDISYFVKNLKNAVSLAAAYKKSIIMQEFGAVNGKATWIQKVGSMCNSMNIPWMPWEVMKPGVSTGDYEFYIHDYAAWYALSVQAIAVKSINEVCTQSNQCVYRCCSNTTITNIIHNKINDSTCVAMTSSSKCLNQGLPVGAPCLTNSDCLNACCSNIFSPDKMRCTANTKACYLYNKGI